MCCVVTVFTLYRILNPTSKTLQSHIFSCAKIERRTTSGCRGTPYFKRKGRELVLKHAISLQRSWGASTVDRLPCIAPLFILIALFTNFASLLILVSLDDSCYGRDACFFFSKSNPYLYHRSLRRNVRLVLPFIFLFL